MSDQLALIPDVPPTLTVQYVEVASIHESPYPTLTSDFVRSIEQYGMMQPPVVRKTANHGYVVVDGRRRVAAMRRLGRENINVLVLDGDCSPEVLALMLNEQRSNNPVSDLAAIEGLVAEGAEIKEICAATGLGKGTVEKRMRLKNLILSFRYIFNEGKLPMGIAERLAKLPAETQGDLFIHYAEVGKLTHGDISEVRYAQQQAALATLPSTLFDGTPEDATGDNPLNFTNLKDAYEKMKPFLAPITGDTIELTVAENVELVAGRFIERIAEHGVGEDFYLWAQKALATILVAAPPDAPKSATDALGFAAQVFADIGEAQAPGFLADDERVDLSDVVITNPEPYDEEYAEENFDAA